MNTSRAQDGFPIRIAMAWLGSLLCVSYCTLAGPDVGWHNISSKRGEIPPPPGGSTQQTGSLVGDFDGDGIDDFIISFRERPPALVWYRRTAAAWEMYVIEKDYLPIEAGGAACDIDGDGDLDVVFGGDWQSSEVWWWENPSPNFDKNILWKRRVIKSSGKNQHHDQCFGDFLGTGKPQLAFWNQQARTLYLAEIPTNPRAADKWSMIEVHTDVAAASTPYTEGLSAYDVDADGKLDLLAYDSWYKHTGGKSFKRVKIAGSGGLIFAGYFKESKHPQVIISPGDGKGRLMLYECTGNPEDPAAWVGRDLIGREVIHCHSLQLGDIDRDGNLDIFCAEMAKWSERKPNRDHPEATAWVLYGDGHGNFRKTEVVIGHGWHEARLADLDGDGDLDLLNKPYNWDTPRIDIWLNSGTRVFGKGIGTSKSFHGPVGLQLYSLREMFAKNVPFAVQAARNFGFRAVELAGVHGRSPAEFGMVLRRAGLKPVSAIVDFDRFVDRIDEVINEAKQLGVMYVGTAGIPHAGQFTEADARKAVRVFNSAGEMLARNGLKFFYHNHGFEFVRHGDETLFDLIVRESIPQFVAFEMDVFWTVHAGQDPVTLLKKYPDRWALMHLKDMRQGIESGQTMGTEYAHSNVALGTGQIDLPAVLKLAQQIGVKHYFVEDESPAVTQQIPVSLRFLESLAW